MPKTSIELAQELSTFKKDKKKQKILENSFKIVKTNLDELEKELAKAIESSADLMKIEEEVLAEGVDKAAKKGKMFFRSVKALGGFAKLTNDHLVPFIILEKRKDITFEELKTFTRNLSNIINPILIERKKADDIMGIDFMVKKRAMTNPLSKIESIRDTLRDLVGADYGLVKILEDLDTVLTDIQSLEGKHADIEQKITISQKNLQELLEKKNKTIAHRKTLEETGNYSVLRQMKAENFNLETDFGTRINPLRKNFRAISSKASELGNVPFIVITAAQNYEEDVLQKAQQDYESNFVELKALLEALIKYADKLDFKMNHVQRFEQLIKIIDNGKLKQEFEAIITKRKEIQTYESSDPTIAQAVAQITQLTKEIDELILKEDAINKESEKFQEELKQTTTSLDERIKRFQELLQEGSKFATQ